MGVLERYQQEVMRLMGEKDFDGMNLLRLRIREILEKGHDDAKHVFVPVEGIETFCETCGGQRHSSASHPAGSPEFVFGLRLLAIEMGIIEILEGYGRVVWTGKFPF